MENAEEIKKQFLEIKRKHEAKEALTEVESEALFTNFMAMGRRVKQAEAALQNYAKILAVLLMRQGGSVGIRTVEIERLGEFQIQVGQEPVNGSIPVRLLKKKPGIVIAGDFDGKQ